MLREADGGVSPELILIGTGSELQLAFSRPTRSRPRHPARVVTLPCWERFEAQDQAYRDTVLPPDIRKRVSVEIGVSMGWERCVGTRARSSGSTTSAPAPRPGRSSRSSGSPWTGSTDVARRVVREGLHGRIRSSTLGTPHGEHPTLAGRRRRGVARTPSSDPGHD